MRKKIGALILAAVPALCITYFPNSHAQEPPNARQSSNPHYLEHITAPANEVDQIIEEAKVLDAHHGQFGTSTYINGNITIQKQIHGKNVTFVFHNYVEQGDQVRHGAQGFTMLSKAQFAAVTSDITTLLERASQEAYNDHSGITRRIVEIQEAHLKRNNRLAQNEKLEDLLDQQIPDYPGLTIADGLNIPRLALQDFVPTQLHFGPLPRSILGVTYLNSEVVGYHPLARQIDFVNGGPNILKHELVHNCKKLQGIPYVYEFDAEFHASMVEQDNGLWFLRHPYLEDARSLAKVLFRFDAKRALENAIPMQLMLGSPIRRDLLEDYVVKIRQIRTEVRRTYLDDFLPEFYTHHAFWTAVNEDLNDGNAAFKIYMWSKYEPTLLQGAQNTARWMQQNRQIIEDASRQALRNIANEERNNEGGILQAFRRLPKEEQDALRSFISTLGIQEKELGPAIRVLERLSDSGTLNRLRGLR